jgi:hypothetical protein
MDIFLIIITVVIIMGIAYILSRPFAHPQPTSVSTGNTQDVHRQYEALLREIKILQEDQDLDDSSIEISSQIEEKKQQAAQLLRLIDAPLEEDLTPSPVQEPYPPEDTRPEALFHRDNTTVCPQCGRRVASSDKFCTHCGNRLQP